MKRITIFLILVLFGLVSSSTIISEPVPPVLEEQTYKLPFWMSSDEYNYDSINNIMTDNNGLTFKTETNGIITINDDRFMAFGLKGKVGQQEITRTSMDLDWTWSINQTNQDYIFIAEAEENGFVWKQYYYFYRDPKKPMKIKHYLENNFNDLTDVGMYYLFNTKDDDFVEYNDTKYYVQDYMPLYKQGNFNNINAKINFNSQYSFNYDDIINNGFNINEFYIGSGSVLDKPNVNITAIGFTKNNGNFPYGTNVEIDPQFSASTLLGTDAVPLNGSIFAIVWCDNDQNDITFGVYSADGTTLREATDLDSSTGCGESTSRHPASIATFNGTEIVVVFQDKTDGDISYIIGDWSTLNESNYNSYGDLDTSAGLYHSVDVATINSTNFISIWEDDGTSSEVIQVEIRDIEGNLFGSTLTVSDSDSGGTAREVSVDAFNETTFVTSFYDGGIKFRIIGSNGSDLNTISDIIDATDGAGITGVSNVINETRFALHQSSTSGLDYNSISIYDIDTTLKNRTVVIDNSGSNFDGLYVSRINDTALLVTSSDTADVLIGTFFGIYDIELNNIYPMTEFYTNVPSMNIFGISHPKSIDIGFCDNNVIISAMQYWYANQTDGTQWFGNCSAVISEEPPSDSCTPPSGADWWIEHNCTLSTDTDQSGYTVYINKTGSLVLNATLETDRINITKPHDVDWPLNITINGQLNITK